MSRELLTGLREQVRRIERPAATVHGVVSSGVTAIDRALPGGGLARGAVHEIMGTGGDEEDGALAAAFAAGILGRLAAKAEGLVLWCLARPDLHGPGLAAHGLDPARLVLVRARRDADILWAMEEGLRAPGFTAVVGEVGTLAAVASRRLQLAAEHSGVIAFLLRRWRDGGEASRQRNLPNAAATRWRIAALPSRPVSTRLDAPSFSLSPGEGWGEGVTSMAKRGDARPHPSLSPPKGGEGFLRSRGSGIRAGGSSCCAAAAAAQQRAGRWKSEKERWRMRRILYLWLPRWPIDRRRRSTLPSTRNSAASVEESAFATVIDAAGRRLLAAVNPAAAAAGLAPGMALADALSFLPGLATAAAEPAADAAALRRLAEWCGRYSPWTAPDEADGVRIEITGSAHLWGGEAALAADLAARLDRQGLACRIAVADTLGAAWALARFAPPGARVVIPPTAEMRVGLAALPVEALRLDPATVQGLRRVGLKQVGDLSAMPRSALARRFGEGVVRRLDQAQGDLPEPLSPMGEAPARRVRLGFAEPIADPADLARAIDRLAADLVGRLALEGAGARRLDLAFHRVDGRVERIVLGTARPSRDWRHLAALFKERLDTVDPGLGIEDAILAAFAVEPLAPEQIGFLRPLARPHPNPPPVCQGPSPLVIPAKTGSQERPAPLPGLLGPRFRGGDGKPRGARPEAEGTTGGIALLLDRLGNRLGLDALSRIEAHQSHIPERASVRVPVGSPSPTQPPPIPSPARGGGNGWGPTPDRNPRGRG